MDKIDKLRKEFNLKDESSKPFNAVVVLCAEEVEVQGENKERIDEAIKIVLNQKVPLIFLGTIKHINYLKDYLAKNKSDITLICPTKRAHESTWTQIRSLAKYLKKKPFGNLLIVSHAYHIPRIKRYCVKYMTDINYHFLPVGKIEDQSAQVESEINKIIKYAEKGDLPLNITER